MELASAVDPEEWHGILDGFFRRLSDGINRLEGTINQYTGDGVMALFGRPIAHGITPSGARVALARTRGSRPAGSGATRRCGAGRGPAGCEGRRTAPIRRGSGVTIRDS